MTSGIRIPDSLQPSYNTHSYPPFMHRPYASIYRDSIFRSSSFNSFVNEAILRSESDWTANVEIEIETSPELRCEKSQEDDWPQGDQASEEEPERNKSELTPNPMMSFLNKRFSKSEPSIQNLTDGMGTNKLKRRKSVTFADMEGMELTEVFYFKPFSILYSGECNQEDFEVFTNFENNNNKTNKQIEYTTNFECGNANPKFQTFLHTQNVVLETLTVDRHFINGWIHVLNLDYTKSVSLRMTQDNWLSVKNITAVYEKSLQTVCVDIFLFKIPLKIGRTEFAILYQTKGMEFWDNNSGRNYHVDICW